MSVKKKISYGVATLAVLAGIGILGRMWSVLDTTRSQVADNTTVLANLHSNDAAAIKRGEYVMRMSDCAACHQADFSGGYKISTPFGDLQTSNITSDKETGIGNMTERGFFNAVRQGRGEKGFLYPAMPYTAYAKLSDADMHDLWAYMSTIKPVNNKIDENGRMNFPYNIRLAMLGWNLLYFNNSGFKPDNLQSDTSTQTTADTASLNLINRGKYIVDGPAHCSVCHTSRNALGGEVESAYLQGGNLGTWFAPDITPDIHSGIGSWSRTNIELYLKTGSEGKSVAAGPMAEAVEHSMQYFSDEDLHAVSAYLKSLPASNSPQAKPLVMDEAAKKQGALAFEVNCSSCHGVQGEGINGMVPAFAGNHSMLNNPTNLITAVLVGTRAPHTAERQTAAGMPSFAWKMDDEQVANVLNYVRNSWGNQAGEITAKDVLELRQKTGAGEKITPPGSR